MATNSGNFCDTSAYLGCVCVFLLLPAGTVLINVNNLWGGNIYTLSQHQHLKALLKSAREIAQVGFGPWRFSEMIRQRHFANTFQTVSVLLLMLHSASSHLQDLLSVQFV